MRITMPMSKPHIMLYCGRWTFVKNLSTWDNRIAARDYCAMRNRKEGRL